MSICIRARYRRFYAPPYFARVTGLRALVRQYPALLMFK